MEVVVERGGLRQLSQLWEGFREGLLSRVSYNIGRWVGIRIGVVQMLLREYGLLM